MKTKNGYVMEGRVLVGLLACSKGLSKHCSCCPYQYKGCGTRLTRDALRYIEELERRIAKYEEE